MVKIMTIEKPRIPDPEVITVNSAPSSSDTTSSNEVQFATKEEYIKHLVDCGAIKKSPNHKNDNFIHLQGHLIIDQTVAAGLSWNDVVVQGTAKVLPGQISQYPYLPLTTNGVATELKTQDIQEFMQHNYCGFGYKDGKFTIPGNLRITNFDDIPNLGSVSADKIFVYDDKKTKIKLENLPTARNGYYNLPAKRIDTTGIKDPYKVARYKGLSKHICNELAPGFFSRIFGNSKNNKNQ